jgi:hypothetical protein
VPSSTARKSMSHSSCGLDVLSGLKARGFLPRRSSGTWEGFLVH